MTTELIYKKKYMGIGRRKKSIARVFLSPGNGNLIINKVSGEKYFQYNNIYLNKIFEPIKSLDSNYNFDIIVLVKGGGLTGQMKAIQLAISRLLCKIDLSNRIILKPLGFLTCDPRIKERKKYGLRKARKAPQYSKR